MFSLRHSDALVRLGIVNGKRISFILIVLYEELNL